MRGQVKVHPDRLKPYFLAKGEPDPFKRPLLHKRWKAAQWGHDYDVNLEKEEPAPHQMKLRPRRGQPEQWEEDKVSVHEDSPESEADDFFLGDDENGELLEDEAENGVGLGHGDGVEGSGQSDLDSQSTNSEIQDEENESVTRLVNDIEEQFENPEPQLQTHVHQSQESSDLKNSYEAHAPLRKDGPTTQLHSPVAEVPNTLPQEAQPSNCVLKDDASTCVKTEARSPVKSTTSRMQRCSQWFRVHKIPFFKRWTHLPARRAQTSAVALRSRTPRRRVVIVEDQAEFETL